MDFHQHSKVIVEEYLGTVAYVDDLIFSNKSETKASIIGTLSIRESVAQIDTPNEKKEVKQSLKRNINPLVFTNAFLKKGIHCALLEVTNEDDSLEPIKMVLKKSDIVILDWHMHQDQGRKATELLLSVLEKSEKPELRLFIIFTNDPNYNELLSNKITPELERIGISNITKDESGCIVRFGHSKIVVLEKENGKKSKNSVSDKELPDRIIEEFVDITKGLVSNTALKSISTIRQNTHYLLNTFNKNLDPAILSHRALLSDTTESEDHIISLISSEILGLLHHNDVRNLVSLDRIKLWILEQTENGINFYRKMKIRKKSDALSEIEKILDKGIPNISPSKINNIGWNNFLSELKHEKDKTKISVLTSIFSEINDNIDEEFAILMTMQSNYQTQAPKLDQGAILKGDDNVNNQYFVCIQPKCDCVRIRKTGDFFVFLPLIEGVNISRFDFILKEDSIIKRFIIQQKPNSIEKFKFHSQKTGLPVYASKSESTWNFVGNKTEDNISVNFRFLGNLKQEYSQRIGNSFASNVSRIGFSESEWLRRWAK